MVRAKSNRAKSSLPRAGNRNRGRLDDVRLACDIRVASQPPNLPSIPSENHPWTSLIFNPRATPRSVRRWNWSLNRSRSIAPSFLFFLFLRWLLKNLRNSGRKFWKEERKEFSRETEREYWKNEGVFKLMKKGYWRIWGKVRFVKIDKKRNIRYSEITKNDLQQASSITTLKTIFKYILLNTHVCRWNHHSRKYYFMNKFCLSIFTQRSYRYLYSPCPKLSTNFHDCSSLW